MNSMFFECNSLKELKIPNLIITKDIDSSNLFDGCPIKAFNIKKPKYGKEKKSCVLF